MYTHAHTHTHTHIHTYTHARTHAHTHMYMYIQTQDTNQVSSHDQNTNSLLPTTSAPTAAPSREGGDGRVVFGRWDLPAPNSAVAAGVVAATVSLATGRFLYCLCTTVVAVGCVAGYCCGRVCCLR